MPPRDKSRFWRKCRILFRRFRFCVWVFILLFLAGLLYLDRVGLPGFIKKPLQNRLRARGLDLQFTRLRWNWHRGLVAESVRLGGANPTSPQLSLKTVRVQLNYLALLKLQVQVNALVLNEGRLVWPIPNTNGPARELAMDNIRTDLRLLPGDLWELDRFQAQFAGAHIELTGVVTNASAVRDWKWFPAGRPPRPGTLQNRLRRLAEILEQIHYSTPPQLKVKVHGDALDLQSFSAHLTLNTPDARTPWGKFQNGALSVLLRPAASNALSHAELNLQAENTQSPWANAANLTLRLNLRSPQPGTDIVSADLDLTAAGIDTRWGKAAGAQITAQWLHSLTNTIPLSGNGQLLAADARTAWGEARQFRLSSRLSTPEKPAAVNESWGWWTNLAPYALDWECEAGGFKSPKLEAGEFACAGEWRAPLLAMNRISSALYGGTLNARADLDVVTRQFRFEGASDFDPHNLSPWLTEKSRRWLAQYSWKRPPSIKADGVMILPAWTNRQPDWRGEVRPSIRLNGEFNVENGAFRGVPFSYGFSHFTYSNLSWRLPDLVATRPEGRLELFHEGNDLTSDYFFRFRSTFDPAAFRALFPTNHQRAFDLVGFSRPPAIEAEVRGRWRDFSRFQAKGRVAVTNFTVRGESADELQAGFEYTNKFLKVIEPRLRIGDGQMTAPALLADFAGRRMYLTNGFSTVDPQTVARAIGPKVGKHIEPYTFAPPPTVRASGVIPLRDERDADLHFDVEGGPFQWLKFRVRHIAGKIDWVGERLALRNVQARFYEGDAVANAEFHFPHGKRGADFSFDMAATDAELRLLIDDLTGKTNRLEGLLTARLTVTEANSQDWQSWQGKGKMTFSDGVIWEIPIFGIFSPVLDTIIPGLGSSRVREGSATFVITNGVVRSDDLELRASVMRLQYSGAVDLQGRVDGRVQAELLRDTWVIGRVLSLALWPLTKVFEYKLTGTLQEPKSDPVFFVPKVVLMIFHPIGMIKELKQDESRSTPAPEETPSTR